MTAKPEQPTQTPAPRRHELDVLRTFVVIGLVFFLCCYALADDDRVRAALRHLAIPVGVLGLVLFAASAPGFLAGEDPFTARTGPAMATRSLFGAAGWCWVTAILGFLDRRRAPRPSVTSVGRGGRVQEGLAYLAVAALPLYVLRQPVVVAFAYGVVGWSAPIMVKYAVIVTGSLAVILVVYEYAVRRTRATRFLFGMQPGPSAPVRPQSS